MRGIREKDGINLPDSQSRVPVDHKGCFCRWRWLHFHPKPAEAELWAQAPEVGALTFSDREVGDHKMNNAFRKASMIRCLGRSEEGGRWL